MKRSMIIKFIEHELQEINKDLATLPITNFNFWNQKAAGLLDMLEDFDMLPPSYSFLGTSLRNWESEDEN